MNSSRGKEIVHALIEGIRGTINMLKFWTYKNKIHSSCTNIRRTSW